MKSKKVDSSGWVFCWKNGVAKEAGDGERVFRTAGPELHDDAGIASPGAATPEVRASQSTIT